MADDSAASAAAPSSNRPRPAALSDPLYYLHNAETLIDWVLQLHAALLSTAERQQLDALRALPRQARALLFRLVMRKGEWFRQDQLDYAEVGPLDAALAALAQAGLIELQPACDAQALIGLCRKDELLTLCRQRWPSAGIERATRKAELAARLLAAALPPQPLADWWPQAPFRIIRLDCRPLMDRLRLMFFGNLRQDWSEFVLAELGHQRYEPVPLSTRSRAFATRAEVDLYLQLQRLDEQLAQGVDPATLLPALPAPCTSDWLEQRRRKLLFALGQAVERGGDLTGALALYRHNPYREARVRYLRLLERTAPAAQTHQAACRELAQMRQPEARLRIERILLRSARKAGIAVTPDRRPALTVEQLTLPAAQGRIEAQVIAQLNARGLSAHHVENRLFTGLFALLFWPAVFAPVPGAFFHPFQAGPADLYHPDFARRRQPLIEAAFAQLRDGRYRELMLARREDKQGVRCQLIHWPTLSRERVELALDCIPAAHLQAVFRQLLLDLRHHRRGLPDLICFEPEQRRYQLIEVKGPNDRLQDHQRLWLEFFHAEGLPARLCQVRFAAD